MARRSTRLWFASRMLLAVLVCLLSQTAGHRSRHLWPALDFNPSVASAQSAGDTLLHPGEVVKKSLEGGAAHSYLLDLEEGKYAHVAVDQRVIESDITLIDPNDQTVLRVISRHRDPTPVSLIAKTSGPYRLTITSHEPKETSGEYQLKFVQVRQASKSDEHRIAAEALFATAEELRKSGDEASNRKAITLFEQAISSWKAAKDPDEEAHTLKRLGDVYVSLNEVNQALNYYQQALHQYQRYPDPRGPVRGSQ